MTSQISRRSMMKQVAAGSAVAVLGSQTTAHAAPTAKIESIEVISPQPDLYCGWPTVTRRRNGQLRVVWSGGRETHVCPFGRVETMVSNDEGKTWSWPRVLIDSAIDDRDAGILETEKGTLIVTTFKSLAYEPSLTAAEKRKPGEPGAWPADKLKRWQAARDRLSAKDRQAQLGPWFIRSVDGGISWSSPERILVSSPHGPTQLADGRLLYAGKNVLKKASEKTFVGVCDSSDDGKSWNRLAEIPTRPGDDNNNYHELYAIETDDNRIIAQIRNHNKKNSGETLQSESSDGGKTWSVPHSISVWGLPSHLLKLKDGRLLMTYGYRRKPYGNQARVSEDHGRTWSKPITISDDGPGHDLGYPSTVQLADGSLLTVWYESMKSTPKAVLRQSRWQLQ